VTAIKFQAPETGDVDPVVLTVVTPGVFTDPVFRLPHPDRLTVADVQSIEWAMTVEDRPPAAAAVVLIARLLPDEEQAQWLEGCDRVAAAEAAHWFTVLAELYGGAPPKR